MTWDKAFPLSYELVERLGMAEPSRDHLVELLLLVYNNRCSLIPNPTCSRGAAARVAAGVGFRATNSEGVHRCSNASCPGHRDEALVKARRGRAYVSSMLTPKAVSGLMLQRIRQHLRLPHPPMQGEESAMEKAPRGTMHSAEARAEGHKEL